MPRRTRVIILITIIVILLGGGSYVGVQLTLKDPLTVRVVGYKRLTQDKISITYEVENTSAFPVIGVAYLGLHSPDPAGYDGYHYVIGDQWDGKAFKRGEKQTFDWQEPYVEGGKSDPYHFLYVWDPMPTHLLRKIYPPYRKQMPHSPVPLRVGASGPFTMEAIEKLPP
ncbi:hypothetical protein DES53_109220 [Roseimicrobium gellanilyticum]|uniref:Uncharacterized protein n=1 Tax=Roseimicrobium gellanilyticum TaxID=748857 RepID=A0A366HBP7_9BACT|nr:hypothetical protein [Roseimicrobium gellanilyticum]RBP39792.1 hypothetical protein DES53_109220 [Roseimicrobium gellanilyticum]